jgi:hypothetical protein
MDTVALSAATLRMGLRHIRPEALREEARRRAMLGERARVVHRQPALRKG